MGKKISYHSTLAVLFGKDFKKKLSKKDNQSVSDSLQVELLSKLWVYHGHVPFIVHNASNNINFC